MKTIIALLLFILCSGICEAQADKVAVSDSLKSSRKTNTFRVNSRHNYNTIAFDSLASTDSVKVWHKNERGKKFPVALRDLTDYSDLSSNLITGVAGRREFLILHPNLYDVEIEYAKASPTKTIQTLRRGNNLK
ncbi:MAG: hypothetical protein HGGPFJEG_03051 [Ignavibacteria bacterium]|nr:hypothetical protein [Ignavibacteria bacterium]